MEKALGYLLGEKFMTLLGDADAGFDVEADVRGFTAEARDIFSPAELRGYFTGPRRIGALAHATDETEYDVLRAAGALGKEDAEVAAQEAIRFERMRRLLLEV